MSEILSKGTAKRRNRKIFYVPILLLVVLVVSYVIFDWIFPKKQAERFPARFTISQQTTIALGPVTKSGFIDYAEAINRKLGDGLAAKDNAAIDLIRALGPTVDAHAFGVDDRTSEFQEIWKKLEMGPFPDDREFFMTIKQFHASLESAEPTTEREQDPPEITPAQAAEDELESVLARPWKAEERPFLGKWLKKNETPLKLLNSALKKKAFFIPCQSVTPKQVSLLRQGMDDDAESLLVLPGTVSVSKLVEVRKALAAQAMLLLGEGRHEEAWKVLRDSHRLAALLSTNGSLMDLVLGVAFDMPLQDATLAFFQEKQIKPEFFKSMIRDLQNLEKYESPAKAYDLFERYLDLSYIMAYNHGGIETALHLYRNSPFEKENELPVLTEWGGRFFSRRQKQAMSQIQWDPVLKQTNDYFDKVVAALATPDRAARYAALKQLQADREMVKPAMRAAFKQWVDYLYRYQYESGWDMQKSTADFCTVLFSDNFLNIQRMLDRGEQKWINLAVAAALEAFKREKGAYPAKLSDLSPEYLKEIPKDLFSQKELSYRRTANGYLLYSVGANETDDGGKMQNSGEHSGDIGMEMPPPAKPLNQKRKELFKEE
jgi:dimeric dUTPase (all-alpha-NTP-PPase superfamily)